jgi:hypothetical protein
MPFQKGHPQYGGKKKGSTHKLTLEKEAAREYVRQRVTQALEPLLDAQIQHALGLKYLVTRSKTGGKFIRVTEAMARAARIRRGNHRSVGKRPVGASLYGFAEPGARQAQRASVRSAGWGFPVDQTTSSD